MEEKREKNRVDERGFEARCLKRNYSHLRGRTGTRTGEREGEIESAPDHTSLSFPTPSISLHLFPHHLPEFITLSESLFVSQLQ